MPVNTKNILRSHWQKLSTESPERTVKNNFFMGNNMGKKYIFL